jgi:hypothetical protein
MSSQSTVQFRSLGTSHLAICDDDACPWQHRGATNAIVEVAGQEHATETGHVVTIHDEHTRRVWVACNACGEELGRAGCELCATCEQEIREENRDLEDWDV